MCRNPTAWSVLSVTVNEVNFVRPWRNGLLLGEKRGKLPIQNTRHNVRMKHGIWKLFLLPVSFRPSFCCIHFSSFIPVYLEEVNHTALPSSSRGAGVRWETCCRRREGGAAGTSPDFFNTRNDKLCPGWVWGGSSDSRRAAHEMAGCPALQLPDSVTGIEAYRWCRWVGVLHWGWLVHLHFCCGNSGAGNIFPWLHWLHFLCIFSYSVHFKAF